MKKLTTFLTLLFLLVSVHGYGALTDNLTAAYEFESGALTTDATASAMTLTNNNTVTSVTGKVGNAANIVRASSQFLSRASEATLQTGNIGFSLAGWFKLGTVGAGNFYTIVGKKGSGTQGEYWVMVDTITQTNPRLSFYVTDGSSNQIMLATTFGDLTAGVYYFFAAVHDPAVPELRLTVNTTTQTFARTVTPAASALTFAIGMRNSDHYFDGEIDQLLFFKRALAAGDLTSLYNSGNGLSYAAMGSGGPVVDFFGRRRAHIQRRPAYQTVTGLLYPKKVYWFKDSKKKGLAGERVQMGGMR